MHNNCKNNMCSKNGKIIIKLKEIACVYEIYGLIKIYILFNIFQPGPGLNLANSNSRNFSKNLKNSRNY